MNRATPPSDRREIAAQMRDTLVQAKMGLSEMRDGLEKARLRLQTEERELATVRRRRQMAQEIGDAETVAIADKYEATHAARVELLGRKVAVQEEEVRIAESDVQAMSSDLRAAVQGTGGFAPNIRNPVAPDLDTPDSNIASEIDALGRARARAERNANADAELEELKRQMGK